MIERKTLTTATQKRNSALKLPDTELLKTMMNGSQRKFTTRRGTGGVAKDAMPARSVKQTTTKSRDTV